MIEAPQAVDEVERLAVLASCGTVREKVAGSLRQLTRTAAEICGTPIALVSMVDAMSQVFWASCGLDVESTPRAVAFCAHAILDDDLFEVEDAFEDERFFDNPLVTGPPHVRFYAGAPLSVHGHNLGTLCAIDHHPRCLTDAQRRHLTTLASQVVAQLELALTMEQLEVIFEQRSVELAELRRFTYRVSHDLKSPVLMMRRFAETALEDIDDDAKEEARANVARIIEIGNDVSELVADLLELTSATQGETPEMTTDLDDLLADVAIAHAESADAAGVELRLDSCHGALRIEQGRLLQILSHLVSNAVKYSDPDRADRFVRISLERDAAELRISVADNGLGIPKVQHGRIFEMFERLHTERANGTGLGMSIVGRHVRALNGTITLESEPGMGTRFVVSIPERGERT
ncbi:MAG: GAF domain-containing sensor histidine kinase [Deltaproteobacteria bacterium]